MEMLRQVSSLQGLGVFPLNDRGTGCSGPHRWTREPVESDGSGLTLGAVRRGQTPGMSPPPD